MSTLTKVLIVLQVVISIFLCGIVVTYVANADDFKEKYRRANNRLGGAEQLAEQAKKELDDYKSQKNAEIADTVAELAQRQSEIDSLKTDHVAAARQQSDLSNQLARMASTVEASNLTALEQNKQFDKAHADRNALDLANISLTKDLKETNDLVIEKMGLIATQNEKLKRLLEEKSELQNQLERFMRQYGKTVPTPRPATMVRSKARPAFRTAPGIGLKGLITDLDVQNHLAEISVGSAHGVREEDKFFVTRGDQFVCNILVLDVDSDKSVGVLDLVQLTPRVGDKVSTNF
ncbi:MAG: hypothetical protein IIC50_01505 [Planctomycetes bacterium]|nr:hypothetical protein [Planctomycetota bacterium]